ncbi:MAG: hypothetical protein NZT92_16865 [Abditibacteriales bacterium]|nr:hypothetical protein [Abditibacteriales bacterium]
MLTKLLRLALLSLLTAGKRHGECSEAICRMPVIASAAKQSPPRQPPPPQGIASLRSQ